MKNVSIKNHDWELTLSPEVGMNPISLRYRGTPILREPSDENALLDEPVLYGMPILLPANRTKNARFTFEDKEYCLPMNEPQFKNHLHGRLYDAPFTVLSHGRTQVLSVLENKGEYYPFPFRLAFADELTEDGYHRCITLTNTGNTALPFTLALHTTFVEPKHFSVPLRERFVCDACHVPTGELLPLNDREASYSEGFSPDGSRISGFYKAGKGAALLDGWRFTVSDDFDEWILYNGNGNEGYLCLEPQCGEVNGLNTDGHRVLQAGESMRFTVSVTCDR